MLSCNQKYIIAILLYVTSITHSQILGPPGAFTQMGFGARGMGLGNAMTAVRSGELSGFYNPATLNFASSASASISYGILSLDRSHNSLFFSSPIDSNASISLGILNAGVGKIDGRDNDGFHTETFSTSENMFSFSFGMRIRKISIGVSTKIYYYSLFKDLSYTGLGFDVGVVYPITSNITIGATIKDLNAKYKWNTSNLYNELGNTTTNKFPTRRVLGISYTFDENAGVLSSEVESRKESTTIVRIGGEFLLIENFALRAGIDGWKLDDSQQAHPSFGFTARSDFMEWKPALNYTYTIEPYGLFSIHVISLSVIL